MSLQLINLRDASRELDYRQRVHNDSMVHASAAKDDLMAATNRSLKRAKAGFDRAIAACNASGVEVSQEFLPRVSAPAAVAVPDAK
jgi:hypothetical protein